MISDASFSSVARRRFLLLGASFAALAASGLPMAVQAQTMGAVIGRGAPVRPATTQTGTPVRSGTMQGALQRQQTTQGRVDQIRTYVASIKAAVQRGPVADGLDPNGLDPTQAIKDALAAARGGDAGRANELLISAGANYDLTGLKTWQGAGLPGQTTDANGHVTVTIDQTQERALLSWNRFDIGANTTLQFNQKSNGEAQPGWVAVNRVTNATDPTLILGNLKADGTVVVLNQAGIIFGKDSQVNTHSLLASTLEIGNAARFVKGSDGPTQATTIRERNLAFLESGLFTPPNGTTGQALNTDPIAPLLVSGETQGNGKQFADTLEGSIIVDRGARIASGAGGFIMLTAPEIDNSGTLSAVDGQVSLQAGRAVTYEEATGAASSADPYVRGYRLNSFAFAGQADGVVANSGVIESKRGYISLGTGAEGSILHSGLLSTTTSVSRNGKISLTAGSVTLAGSSDAAQASGIVMLADDSSETIPQGSPNAPSEFKQSQLEIGTQVLLLNQKLGALVATEFSMGENALIYAPGADVAVGAQKIEDINNASGQIAAHPGRVEIARGALIDVSGLKNVQLDASRNSIEIAPVKRGELRDTPNYREVEVDGNFSLNGKTIYIDPRVHGVRDDGVAWVGSPLIEAASIAGQIPASAQEFMTKGGSVSLVGTELSSTDDLSPGRGPAVSIDQGAVIDFSGGWVSYSAGTVKTSKLVTVDGRIVDIAKANPNDVYVDVISGTTEVLQPRIGILQSWLVPAGQGQRYDAAYDEGRDAGALMITAADIAIDGNFYGGAFAGARQIAGGNRPSLELPDSQRTIQRSPSELPSGGALSISSLGDIVVYHGERGEAASNRAELLLNDAMLTNADLSLLSLTAFGSVTFAGLNPVTLQDPDALRITGTSALELAPGGVLTIEAGRTIRFDGTVRAPSGSISATTTLFGRGLAGIGSSINGSAFRIGMYGDGIGDDISPNFLYSKNPGDLNPFDIDVTGTLSTAGLWVNDLLATDGQRGGAFRDGGSITLRPAADVFMAIGDTRFTATEAVDLSGSIRISGTLNVSSGGYVTPTGSLVLDGKGGDVSLVNATVYASTRLTESGRLTNDRPQTSTFPIGGTTQSVEFTPLPAVGNMDQVLPSLVAEPRSTVDIASASIIGYGFAGGGTFELVAPDISFGSDNRSGTTHIGFDFFKSTGFGTLDVSSNRSRIVDDLFSNDRTSKSAFLDTTRFVVGAGETLDLTQWMLPTLLSTDQSKALRQLGSDSDLQAQAFLAPTTNEALWDRRAAHLVLGGLTELDVMQGGSIIGAPEASLTVSKLYNAGSIVLHGGTIAQHLDNPAAIDLAGLGVRGSDLGGNGLADAFGGPIDGLGRFLESAENSAGVIDPSNSSHVLSNAELVSRDGADRQIYFLGLVDHSDGIVLAAGSTTNLSGIGLLDPRTPLLGTGVQRRTGKVLDGGSLTLEASRQVQRRVSLSGQFAASLTGRALVREDDAVVDISGASLIVDQTKSLGQFAPYLEWSQAGSISALGGGRLGTTPILAFGGDARAEGGTIEWLDPTIGSGTGAARDYLSADLIKRSGFDTLIARGGVELDGEFSLILRKALMVTSQDPLIAGSPFGSDGTVSIRATEGTRASLGASYVRLASRLGFAASVGSAPGEASLTLFGGSQGIDLVGGIGIDPSISAVALSTPGDVRLTGVSTNFINGSPTYDGAFVVSADLFIDARRTYATTGTGNLQGLLEGASEDASRPYFLAAVGDRTITFGNGYLDPTVPAPLSAGTHISVLAPHIVQNGYLAAPLGRLTLGSREATIVAGVLPTETVTFGSGSVTSVSAAGLQIPYGSTTDLIEYYFPTISTPLTQLPVGELVISGTSIVQHEGALVDGRGGGDVFAYEFQSGIGGSHDVLDRFNSDAFSSNHYDPATGKGYQFPDQRQVYALVPVADAGKIAAYDPIYSADYDDLYGAQAGRTVTLDGGHGIAAGDYLLVPAKYAKSIPGALRLVENTGTAAPLPGTSTQLLDGSVVVGGTYGFADTGIAESTRHSFTVQTKDVFTRYSRIETTSGSDYLVGRNEKEGLAAPRLPLDAARIVLAPLTELKLAGAFDLGAGDGGQRGQIDILGSNILIAGTGAEAPEGALLISDSTLAKLDAPSLLVGGRRSDNADGTTTITASANRITIAGDAHVQASELLFSVGGAGSVLAIEDGASLAAVGDPGILTDADYATSGAGSILRLANGPERLVARSGTGASSIEIGAVTLSGEVLALDTSGSFVVADSASLNAKAAAISGTDILFAGANNSANDPGVIGMGLAAKLAAAEQLTVRSPGSIRFEAGSYSFNDLVLDSASLAADAGAMANSAVRIEAGRVRLTNSAGLADGCVATSLCGSAGSLTLSATTLTLGSGDVHAAGFNDRVILTASDGIYVEGKGSFNAGSAALALETPFIAERAMVVDPRDQVVRPDYTFLTAGAVAIAASAANPKAEIDGNATPGARIAFGTSDDRVASLSIDGATIRATAGIIDVQSKGTISLAGATLATPGYEKTFGDEVDPVVVSAGGGTVNLFSAHGDIITDQSSALIIDSGKGNAGTLNLLAGNGAVTLLATLNLGPADGEGALSARQGSFTLDSGAGSFDFAGFVDRYGQQFGGDIAIRTGAGDLTLAAGQRFKTKSVSLTADGGLVGIAGTLDTSGVDVAGMSADAARNAEVNGGDIQLWGQKGVTLASTALLDTHTTGYADTDSRPAKAGNIILGIGLDSAALNIASGAVLDAGARRTQTEPGVGRLIPQVITDPATGSPVTVYRYAEPDQGGTVTFRAPVIGTGRDKVALSQNGSILGADSIQLEAYQRYDLDQMADSGAYSGISRDGDGRIKLDFGVTGANPFTTDMALGDGTSSLVRFVQGFDVSTVDGSSLDGMRLRPGIELVSTGAISTTSQWNLAAASFSPEQLQAAVDAGVLELIPEISSPGQPQYKVVPGKEGQLLDHYATFLYRTDGGSARGEAPVVTFRAGGDLTIDRSISDGFFAFRDKSDPDYVNYQLGGGDRTYQPAIQFSCGGLSGLCSNIAGYGNGSNPGAASTLTISLNTQASQGSLFGGLPNINSPLSLVGNGASGGEDRNTLGFAELFPLLDGDTAMHSSDLRLVAGAGDVLSANPLHVDHARTADVIVSGQYSYRLTATGSVTFDGPLQFHLQRAATDPTNINFNIGDTLDVADTTAGLNQLKDDAYTQLNWGSAAGLGADVRVAAQIYFAGKPYSFVGNSAAPTGIIAPLNEVVAFLQTFEPTYQAGLASGRAGYTANRTLQVIRYGNATQQNSPTAPNQAWVRTAIRTGDGDIAVAASRDIDLRGGAEAVYRRADGTSTTLPNYAGGPTTQAVQFAASALYTAGVRVAPVDRSARIAGTGERVSLTPDSPYLIASLEDASFIPSPKGISGNQPALADGGGDVLLDAGRDVLGRRDEWTQIFGTSGQGYTGARTGTSTGAQLTAGQQTQLWRTGSVGGDTEIGLSADYFRSGVGALAGGDVSIEAGRDVSDLTIVLGATATTTLGDSSSAMMTFGTGNLTLDAGRDVLAGSVDVANGAGSIRVGRDIASFGQEPIASQTPKYLRVRLADAVVDIEAGGSAVLGSVSALGVDQRQSSAGFFSPAASFALSAVETARIAQSDGLGGVREYGQVPSFLLESGTETAFGQVLPPSMELTSLMASVELPQNFPQILYPSAIGQLRMFSAGDIKRLVVGMDDADPGLVGGAFSNGPEYFRLPGVTSATSGTELRNQHNRLITHAGDLEPVRIYTDGNINQAAIFLPKQARIAAAGDIVDLFFQGQNVTSSDTSRVVAGGDIRGTIGSGFNNLPYVRSNNFILGGPGAFIVEAGGDLGPFVSSTTVNGIASAGGIRTVGNDYNPWLPDDGASLSVRFGMAGGADYTALRETYLNPENLAMLDGDLFVQVTDSFGNQRPDREKSIYAPLLAEWLETNAPDAFAAIFGNEDFARTDTGRAALADASYSRMTDLYTAFAAVDPLRQQRFLVDTLYFNELAQVANADGPSFNQFVRGYRAVQTLFPTARGYTDNLAPYTLDPATVSDDHPLGEPVRNMLNGQPQVADRVMTGNADLRLATIQTARGGDVTILAPGGDMLAGSVVRTSEQATRRSTVFATPSRFVPLHQMFEGGNLTPQLGVNLFDTVPLGYEGILTLRGGQIRSFTDGDFILNQSRVFSQQSGNITMWSSNGDLAAGQGPKSASNFPPVTVRFDENGFAEVNSAGSVSGAGIGSFQRTPEDPPSDVLLIAPVGEVDAGDAGVRASGNIVVAAARVANADNFKAAGDLTGVPTTTANVAVVTPQDAASAIAAQAAAASNTNNQADRRSLITVDVLGPANDGRCDPNIAGDPDCKR